MKYCPICQSELILESTERIPYANISMTFCPKKQDHMFEITTAKGTDGIFLFVYSLENFKISFYPPTNHVIIRPLNDPTLNIIIFSGTTNFNFADFSNLDKIKKHIKILSVFK